MSGVLYAQDVIVIHPTYEAPVVEAALSGVASIDSMRVGPNKQSITVVIGDDFQIRRALGSADKMQSYVCVTVPASRAGSVAQRLASCDTYDQMRDEFTQLNWMLV